MSYHIDNLPDFPGKEVIQEAAKKGKQITNSHWPDVKFKDEWLMLVGLCDIIAELRKAKQ